MIERAKERVKKDLPLTDLAHARSVVGAWFKEYSSAPEMLRWMVDNAFETELLKEDPNKEILHFLDVAMNKTGVEYSIVEEDDGKISLPVCLKGVPQEQTLKNVPKKNILSLKDLDALSSLRFPKRFPRPELHILNEDE